MSRKSCDRSRSRKEKQKQKQKYRKHTKRHHTGNSVFSQNIQTRRTSNNSMKSSSRYRVTTFLLTVLSLTYLPFLPHYQIVPTPSHPLVKVTGLISRFISPNFRNLQVNVHLFRTSTYQLTTTPTVLQQSSGPRRRVEPVEITLQREKSHWSTEFYQRPRRRQNR